MHIRDSVYIARQPILDGAGETIAYELLYRDGTRNAAVDQCGMRASATVIKNAFLEFGIDALAGGKRVFINTDRELLLSGALLDLPAETVVVEVLEDIRIDSAVHNALEELRRRNFVIAFDDFVANDERTSLLGLANIVKVELPAFDLQSLARSASELKARGLMILAEKVESHAQFEYCRTLGFDLFQGFYFMKPEMRNVTSFTPHCASAMRLLSLTQNEQATLEDVAAVIRVDPSLTFKLVRFVNSPLFASRLKVRVNSIEHAAAMLGFRKLAQLASVLLLAQAEGKPSALSHWALTRARMCELIAERSRLCKPENAFMVGIISMLDAFLDTSIEHAIEGCSLADEIVWAVLHRFGTLGRILDCVIAHEQDDWCEEFAYASTDCYNQAITWADCAMNATLARNG